VTFTPAPRCQRLSVISNRGWASVTAAFATSSPDARRRPHSITIRCTSSRRRYPRTRAGNRPEQRGDSRGAASSMSAATAPTHSASRFHDGASDAVCAPRDQRDPVLESLHARPPGTAPRARTGQMSCTTPSSTTW
jgi:hypothetical protein